MAYSNYNDNKGFPYSNLNKALTPMLLLSALELQPMYINEIVTMLEKERARPAPAICRQISRKSMPRKQSISVWESLQISFSRQI